MLVRTSSLRRPSRSSALSPIRFITATPRSLPLSSFTAAKRACFEMSASISSLLRAAAPAPVRIGDRRAGRAPGAGRMRAALRVPRRGSAGVLRVGGRELGVARRGAGGHVAPARARRPRHQRQRQGLELAAPAQHHGLAPDLDDGGAVEVLSHAHRAARAAGLDHRERARRVRRHDRAEQAHLAARIARVRCARRPRARARRRPPRATARYAPRAVRARSASSRPSIVSSSESTRGSSGASGS